MADAVNAVRDGNFVESLLAVSSADGTTPVVLWANPTTHALLVEGGVPGTGTVESVSSADGNLTITDPTVNPVLTIVNSPTVTVADAGGDTTTFPLLGTDATGNLSPRTDAGLTYDATTNVLTATGGFVGSLTGTASLATDLAGGLGGQIPYQNAVNDTVFLANGTAGQILQSNGTTLAPSWVTSPDASVTLLDVSTNSTTTPNSVYQMSAGIPVEFRKTGALPLLYLDETNRKIGINTVSPQAHLSIVTQDGTTDDVYSTRYFTGTTAAGFVARHARGTEALPTAVLADDRLGGFGARGYGATAFATGSSAIIFMTASENWSDTAQGTYISFLNTLAGTTTRNEYMRLDSGGNLGLGTDASNVFVPAGVNNVLRLSKTFTIDNGTSQNSIQIDVNSTIGAAQVSQIRGMLVTVRNSGTTSGTGLVSGSFFTVTGNGTQNYSANNFTGHSVSLITLSGQSGTITDTHGFRLNAPSFAGSKPTTAYGYRAFNQGVSGITNSYAFYADAQSGSTNNYAFYALGTASAFGTIELGAVSDTTLSRVSAGVVAIEGVNIVDVSSAQTLTNKTITGGTNILRQITSITDSATPTPTGGSSMNAFDVTALAQAATFAAPSGTPLNFNTLIIRIKDNGTARALTWNSVYAAGGVALPSTTVLSKILTLGFIYNTANSLNKWQCVASSQEA